MKIKHIVFDWDGTLADTYPVISKAYEHTFNALDIPAVSYDEIKKLTSTLQNKDTLDYIFGKLKEDAKKIFYEYINDHHTLHLQPIKGAQKLLQFCKNNNIKTYLITNKKRNYLLEEANKLDFTSFFSKIVTAGEFSEDKPHSLATHAVFENNLPNANSIMVIGDGLADYKTARTYDHDNQTAFCVIYDPYDKYSEDNPDYKVKNLTDIIDILKSLK